MYPCVSPKRCMCNVSTGHAQGLSQWAPVFSQAIHLPTILSLCQYKAVHIQHLVSLQLAVSYHLRIILYTHLIYQHGFHIVKELMNSEPCNRTLQ